MRKKLTPFFGTHSDLVTLARDVIAVRPIDFVHGGMFAEPVIAVLNNINDLSVFETYIVVDHGIPVGLRVVPQRAGGQMYAVDQVVNPHTIVLQTGGRYSDHHLIAGQIGTTGNNKQSDDLYAFFARAIRKRFEKVKSFYVGPEAAILLDNGARLSVTSKSPEMYDLVR